MTVICGEWRRGAFCTRADGHPGNHHDAVIDVTWPGSDAVTTDPEEARDA